MFKFSDKPSDQAMQKKRRILQTNPKDLSPIRTSFLKEFRSSENQSNAAKADEPKTSEYAFFKKLKTDAGQRFNSHPVHQEDIRPNKFQAWDCPTERISKIKNSSKDFRLPIEDVINANRRFFVTPVAVGVDLKRASTTFQGICNPGTSIEECGSSRPTGTQNKYKDLFSKKRQKLYQCVAESSFPEIGELCSKGYDIVSVLLSRLFPESNEENVESVSKNKLLTMSPAPKKLPHQSPRNSLEVECGSYMENGLPACWLDSLRERTPANPDSPTYNAHNILLDYNLRQPSFKLGERNNFSRMESDSAFSFQLKNHGHLPSNHLREQNHIPDPNESLIRRKQHPLLLGWDSENVTNERTSLISHNTGLIKQPMTLSSWGSDYEESLDDEFSPFGARALCASPVICKHTPSFYSLPPSHSTTYCEDEYRRHYLEDNRDIAGDLNHYPLAISLLSHMPSYPSVTEYCNHDPTHEGSWTLSSPGNHHWFVKEVLSDQHYNPGMEVFFSSKVDYDLGRKCLSISESSNKHYSFIRPSLQSPRKKDILSHLIAKDEYENRLDELIPRGILNHYNQAMFSIHDWASFYCPINQKPNSLRLDKSVWDEFEGKIHEDRNDIEYL